MYADGTVGVCGDIAYSGCDRQCFFSDVKDDKTAVNRNALQFLFIFLVRLPISVLHSLNLSLV